MSERKEEIFKESSKNKNSPCPNTLAPFRGGLEGRGNLSNISISPNQEKRNKKAQSVNVRLTRRDKLIIDLLQKQDFCFYSDIKKKFFSSDASACNRLSKLKNQGHILIEPVDFHVLKRNLDNSSLGLIGRNLKIVSLSDKCHLKKRESSDWKKTHQLLLFSVKERLEKLLNKKAIFENQVKDLKETLHTGKV